MNIPPIRTATNGVTVTDQPSLSPSLVRTLVPILVGYLLALAAKHGLNIGGDGAVQILTTVLTAVYYTTARALEHYVSGNFGWLLGKPSPPQYDPAPTADGGAVELDLLLLIAILFCVLLLLLGVHFGHN